MTISFPAGSFPAGAARTGTAIVAVFAFIAQCRALREGSSAAALVLHLACAGLVYLLFVNLSQRRLGAPLIAALIFSAHPAAAETLASGDGTCACAGLALALLSAVLLARSPLDPRLVWPSLVLYAASLPLAPATIALPLLVAGAIVGYHGLAPSRLLSARLRGRFLIFLPVTAAGSVLLATKGSGEGFGRVAGHAVALAWPFATAPRLGDAAGGALVAALFLFGLLRLRSTPKLAWPALALGITLATIAVLPDAWGRAGGTYAPLAFAALLVAEGLEELYFRCGAAVAMPLVFVVCAALAAQSHLLLSAGP